MPFGGRLCPMVAVGVHMARRPGSTFRLGAVERSCNSRGVGSRGLLPGIAAVAEERAGVFGVGRYYGGSRRYYLDGRNLTTACTRPPTRWLSSTHSLWGGG